MRRAPRRGGSRRRCVSGAGGRGGEGEGGGGRGEEEAQVKCARVKLQEGGGGRRTSHLGPSTSTLLSGTQQQGSFQQREIDVASVGSQPCVGQLLPLSPGGASTADPSQYGGPEMAYAAALARNRVAAAAHLESTLSLRNLTISNADGAAGNGLGAGAADGPPGQGGAANGPGQDENTPVPSPRPSPGGPRGGAGDLWRTLSGLPRTVSGAPADASPHVSPRASPMGAPPDRHRSPSAIRETQFPGAGAAGSPAP